VSRSLIGFLSSCSFFQRDAEDGRQGYVRTKRMSCAFEERYGITETRLNMVNHRSGYGNLLFLNKIDVFKSKLPKVRPRWLITRIQLQPLLIRRCQLRIIPPVLRQPEITKQQIICYGVLCNQPHRLSVCPQYASYFLPFVSLLVY